MSWKRLLDLVKLRLKELSSNHDPELATKLLITANLIGFGAWQKFPDFMKANFVLSEENTIKNQKYYTIATSSFSDNNFGLTLINSIILWLFGNGLSRTIGAGGILSLYACGAVSNFVGLYYQTKYQGKELGKFDGAHASVGAIFAYYIITNPWEELVIFFISVPAILIGSVVLYYGSTLNQNPYLYGACGSLFYGFLRLLLR